MRKLVRLLLNSTPSIKLQNSPSTHHDSLENKCKRKKILNYKARTKGLTKTEYTQWPVRNKQNTQENLLTRSLG